MTLQQVTKPEPLDKRLQVFITEDGFRRLNVEAARRSLTLGQMIDRLARQLPAVDVPKDALSSHPEQSEPVGARS